MLKIIVFAVTSYFVYASFFRIESDCEEYASRYSCGYVKSKASYDVYYWRNVRRNDPSDEKYIASVTGLSASNTSQSIRRLPTISSLVTATRCRPTTTLCHVNSFWKLSATFQKVNVSRFLDTYSFPWRDIHINLNHLHRTYQERLSFSKIMATTSKITWKCL